jgi:hypothetical protein
LYFKILLSGGLPNPRLNGDLSHNLLSFVSW